MKSAYRLGDLLVAERVEQPFAGETQVDPGAFADLAGNIDADILAVGQRLDDSEPEPGAFMAAADAAVGLDERLEDALEIGG